MSLRPLETPDSFAVGIGPEINVSGISKRYGTTIVLDEIDLTIMPGEIHGILGENGAGKSTLLKILGGAITADSGLLSLNGRSVKINTPRDSIAHGISLISQELALVPNLSVLDNVFLGRWANAVGVVMPRLDLMRFNQVLRETGFDLDPNAIVGQLPIGQAQQVEILKALLRGATVLCMDEPTAVLNEAEKEILLKVIRNLARAGTTIILVSHYLEEVLELADRVTVLRDGKHIITDDASSHTPESLVALMVGREVDILHPAIPLVPADAETIMNVVGLTTRTITDVTLKVRRGEILGIAGLVGSGRSEMLLAIFGADRVIRGHIDVAGMRIVTNSIRASIRAGVALVPASRKDQGLVMQRSVSENIALPTLSSRSVAGFVKVACEKASVASISTMVDLRGVKQGASIARLSGGNQQKALFAKWLLNPPAVLMADEPTRGVDIAAKARIHRMIGELAAAGTAVIIVSSELEEIIGLSHRIKVMRRGRLVAEFDRKASREEIMTSAFLK